MTRMLLAPVGACEGQPSRIKPSRPHPHCMKCDLYQPYSGQSFSAFKTYEDGSVLCANFRRGVVHDRMIPPVPGVDQSGELGGSKGGRTEPHSVAACHPAGKPCPGTQTASRTPGEVQA